MSNEVCDTCLFLLKSIFNKINISLTISCRLHICLACWEDLREPSSASNSEPLWRTVTIFPSVATVSSLKNDFSQISSSKYVLYKTPDE